jgi:hypothetical protein
MDEFQEWYEQESEEALKNLNMEQFDQYVENYLQSRKKHEEMEKEAVAQGKTVALMALKLMEFFEAMGKEKHVTASGTISVVTRQTYKASEGEGREEIVNLLKEKNLYDQVVAFNAAKFSSWYATELASNPEFKLPGVELNKMKYVQFRKG